MTNLFSGLWALNASVQGSAGASQKTAMAGAPELTMEEELAILRRVQILANALDNRFGIPGTNIRVGWDSIIGLVPGIGDVATGAMSCYLIYLGRQLNVPNSVMRKMVTNVAIDVCAGLIPVVGDAMDVVIRANLKNARILERHLHTKHSMKNSGGSKVDRSGVIEIV